MNFADDVFIRCIVLPPPFLGPRRPIFWEPCSGSPHATMCSSFLPSPLLVSIGGCLSKARPNWEGQIREGGRLTKARAREAGGRGQQGRQVVSRKRPKALEARPCSETLTKATGGTDVQRSP